MARMRAAIQEAVAAALGAAVTSTRQIGGGSINDAFACGLADGRRVFVKSNRDADPRMFPCEARGLAWLADANALRVPRVLAVSADFLALEHLEPGRPTTPGWSSRQIGSDDLPGRAAGFEAELGRGLAALHRAGAARFGHDEDNFLATLEQDNTPSDDWPSFYAERRLAPLVRRAIDAGHAPPAWAADLERLAARMPDLAGPPEPPARLHGDLWSGNLHADPAGAPVLIDPAVYGGHREIDLAMLRLFGGPGARFTAAYDEVYPRAPGHEERVPLYQLYPLLAHVCLFGGGYVGQAQAAMRRYR
jgi:fructosamine-3-kinase